jgi:hypothetical protein
LSIKDSIGCGDDEGRRQDVRHAVGWLTRIRGACFQVFGNSRRKCARNSGVGPMGEGRSSTV